MNPEYLTEILARLIKSKTVKGVMEQLDAKFPSNKLLDDNVDTGTTKTGEVPVSAKLNVDRKETKRDTGSKDQKTQIKIEEYRGYAIYEFENTFSQGQNHHRMWILRLMIFLHVAMYSTMFR